MPKRSLNPGNGDRTEEGRAAEPGCGRDAGAERRQVGKAAGGDRAIGAHRGGLAQSAECEFQGTIEIRIRRRKNSMSTVAEPVAAVRTTATPRFAFRDPAKAIEFYKQALGAKEIFRFEVGGKSRTPS